MDVPTAIRKVREVQNRFSPDARCALGNRVTGRAGPIKER
jgi:hypothetical protein